MDRTAPDNNPQCGILQPQGLSATAWLEAVVDISRQIANLEALPTVLQSIVRVTTELANADVAIIAPLNQEQLQLVVRCFAAKQASIQSPTACETLNFSMAMCAVEEERTLRFPQDRQAADAMWRCPMLVQPLQTAVAVPLTLDGTCIGVLVAGRHTSEHFTRRDASGLEHLAHQTVIGSRRPFNRTRAYGTRSARDF
ncbi:MAG: GAF domain-containing protein [Chloroflexota bacterium]